MNGIIRILPKHLSTNTVVVLCVALFMACVFWTVSAQETFAQAGVPVFGGIMAAAPSGTCTTDPQFNPTPPGSGEGVISRLTTYIKTILDSITQVIFQYIVGNSGFRQMVAATMTLYVAVYGILFTFAMVQTTLFDFITRAVKFGILWALILPGAWGFFSSTVVTFFNDGTDYLITILSNIAVAGIVAPVTPGNPPFQVIDNAIYTVMSAKMAVTLLATFFTGPYGLLFGLLLLMAVGSFMRTLLLAAWVYLMSLIVKTLLFSIAPLFIACLLFNRTRSLFQGWLNQILNASLQPIFLFAFFAFFSALITAAMKKILQVPVCWTESMESIRGTPFYTHYWRFTQGGQPYGGMWSWTGTDNAGSPAFPIDIMTILIFLLLAELASRFNNVVLMIARDIAGAATSLADMKGSLSDLTSKGPAGRKGGEPGDIGTRETTRDVMRREAGGSMAAGGSPRGGDGGNTTSSGGIRDTLGQARDDAGVMTPNR